MATQNVQQSHIAGHSNYTYFDTVKPSSYSSHDAIQQLGPYRTLVFIPASQPETNQTQQTFQMIDLQQTTTKKKIRNNLKAKKNAIKFYYISVY